MNALNSSKKSLPNSFKDFLKHLAYFAFILNKDGAFLFTNSYCETILGFSANQLYGTLITDRIVEKHRKKIKRFLSKAKGNTQDQILFIKNDGSTVAIEWSAIWDDNHEVWFCSGMLSEEKNNTKQLQLEYEKKLKEHNLRLTSLLEKIGEGFVALDEEGRVLYWNKEAELISGKLREEVLTRKIWECYPEMATPEFCSFYNKAIELQTHQQYEAYYHNEKKWIEIMIHPGNQGITAFFRNVTEIKSIEEELEVQKKQTRKRVISAAIEAQEKERSQISKELHDNINQVLTTVKLYTELCVNDLGNKELMQKSMSLLQSCIDEIRSLSKQLSAPSLGKISLKDSLKDLVKTMMATGKTKIRLHTKDIKDIQVNNQLHLGIYRILQEHLTNILKHADAKNVRIVVSHFDDDIVLKVSDDGKGFDLDKVSGGIGIANMTSRAESLGGSLNINSAHGLGCVLIAHFPGS